MRCDGAKGDDLRHVPRQATGAGSEQAGERMTARIGAGNPKEVARLTPIRADDAPTADWTLRLQIQFLFPK